MNQGIVATTRPPAILSRRGFVRLAAASLAAAAGVVTLTRGDAREAEPGDDHGGLTRGTAPVPAMTGGLGPIIVTDDHGGRGRGGDDFWDE